MSKCKFCNWEENGDVPEDRRDIMFIKDITIPIKQKNLVGKMYVTAQIAISKENKKQTLGLFIWDDENENEIFLCDKQVEINFCPMCGKKLI